MPGNSPLRRLALRWGGPAAALAAVSAAEAWLYADAVARGVASVPPRLLSLLAGATPGGAPAALLDMFALALPVNLLVFGWCRAKVEERREKALALAKSALSPEDREKIRAMISARIRERLAAEAAAGRPRTAENAEGAEGGNRPARGG